MKGPFPLIIYTSNPNCPQAQAWAKQYEVKNCPVVLRPLSQLPQVNVALPTSKSL